MVVDADAPRCTALRKDGSPCTAPARPSTAWCWIHDPAGQDRLRETRAAGGRARGNSVRAGKLMPAKLRPVLDTLLDALSKVEDGGLTPQQASSMAAVAGAVVKVFQVGTLEERLAALEAAQQTPAGRRTA